MNAGFEKINWTWFFNNYHQHQKYFFENLNAGFEKIENKINILSWIITTGSKNIFSKIWLHNFKSLDYFLAIGVLFF